MLFYNRRDFILKKLIKNHMNNIQENRIVLSWSEWQHWKDMRFRDAFNWIEIINRGEEDDLEANSSTHWIIIPISKTHELIQELNIKWQTENIINFSGIMSTTPESIRDNKWVENLHFLFWPGQEGTLRACLAYENTELSLAIWKIIDNSRKNDIWIIETDTEEHDEKMTNVQWLHHLVRWILNKDNVELPISPIKTNPQTVREMITWNPYMISIIDRFKEKIKNNEKIDILKIFMEIAGENLTRQDIDKFWTHKFKETLRFARGPRKEVMIDTSEILKFLWWLQSKK